MHPTHWCLGDSPSRFPDVLTELSEALEGSSDAAAVRSLVDVDVGA
jgi:hypothetical protein